MKKIVILIILIGLLFLLYRSHKEESSNLAFQGTITNQKQQTMAHLEETIGYEVTNVITTYKENGLSGIKELSFKCYDNLMKLPEIPLLVRCLSIDITANFIDESISKQMGFKQDDYFHSISIDVRVQQVKDYLPVSKEVDISKLQKIIRILALKNLQK